MADRGIPSLIAIRSFHAVAEAGGILGGAGRLNVTPGAIRHQIRQLEAFVGQQLVCRGRRDFALTAAGIKLHAKVAEAFHELDSAFHDASAGAAGGELQVACAPALAALRMTKVIMSFAEQFPLVTVRLHPIEQASEDVDVIVSFGDRPISGTRRTMLRNETYFPVCSPALLYQAGPIRTARDLRHHLLLHSIDDEDWRRMLRTLGEPQLAPRQNVFLPDSHLALTAAQDGMGIAIGSTILCAEDLRAGSLVKVLDAEMPAPFPYFVIVPNRRTHELADAFVSVLMRDIDR